MAWNGLQYVSKSNYYCCWKKVAVVAVIGFTVHFTAKYYKNRAIRLRKANYKKDVVILHQIGRGKSVPNISPYCLKLETYLRAANIPYENDFEQPAGRLGKTPWITYNGEEIIDSRLCIEYLNKKLNINLNSNLNDEEIAIDHMIKRLLDELVVHGLILCRWINSTPAQLASLMNFGPLIFPLPFWYICRLVRKNLTLRLKYEGVGLHSKETILEWAKEDLRQLSTFIGKKKFVFGEKLSECDIVLFSWVAQFIWTTQGTEFEEWIHGEFSNLKEHCIRIKELYWPDWESCLDK